MRGKASKKNRMLMLLWWDMYASVGSLALFFVMLVGALQAQETLADAADGHVEALEDDLEHLAESFAEFSFWTSWRCRITFVIFKLVFMLSSFPFFFFIIGPLNSLFTHTDPTGYTRSGRVTAMDTSGLAAYLEFIKADVLKPSRFANELAENFPEKQIDRLRKAVADAETLLVKAWQRPATALRITRKKRAELDALLGEIVTRDTASDALFQVCFPDKVLIEEYKRKLETEAAEAAEARHAHPNHRPSPLPASAQRTPRPSPPSPVTRVAQRVRPSPLHAHRPSPHPPPSSPAGEPALEARGQPEARILRAHRRRRLVRWEGSRPCKRIRRVSEPAEGGLEHWRLVCALAIASPSLWPTSVTRSRVPDQLVVCCPGVVHAAEGSRTDGPRQVTSVRNKARGERSF
jgi:hypothetical protein